MIEAKSLTKVFEEYTALNEFTSNIKEGSIYGLVGSNGSGKSTLLRLISGIYKPDGGEIFLDGAAPFENPEVKNNVIHVSDDPFFFPQSNMEEMSKYYESIYSTFDRNSYNFLVSNFPIDPKKKIQNFSKGMKRQVSLILALSCKCKYLLLDEAFDGLDPIIREVLRKILSDAISERNLTVMIASHNLRELEDLCDHMGLLHQGKIIFEREIDESKLGVCKVQLAFSSPPDEAMFNGIDILKRKDTGSVIQLTVRGNSHELKEHFAKFNPHFIDTVPLTLEEVFMFEMEGVGYDYNNIIF